MPIVLGFRINRIATVPKEISPRDRGIYYSLFAFVAYFVCRGFIELWFDSELEGGTMGAQCIAGMNVALIFGIYSLFFMSAVSTELAFWAFCIGIAIYAGINLVGDNYLFIGRDVVFGESRLESSDFRWLPPLVRSNSFFAMTCSVAVGMTIYLLVRSRRKMISNPIFAILLLIASSVTLYAIYKTQFRANVIIIAISILWLAIPTLLIQRQLCFWIFVAMIVFPALFQSDLGYQIVENAIPDRIMMSFGEKIVDSESFNERTMLYKYGGSRLMDLKVALIGEGPVYRDASDGLGIYKWASYRMPYHSGVMDLFVAHGLFIGIGSLVLIFKITFRLCELIRSSISPGGDKRIRTLAEPALLNIVLWMSTSVMDSGLSNLETFCFATFPAMGALAAIGRLTKATRPRETSTQTGSTRTSSAPLAS